MEPLKTLPASSNELVQELDIRYPATCIGEEETLRQADRRAGKRELIDWLLELQKKES